MVNPNDLVVDGWDISGLPLDQAMKRAKVLDVTLQKQLYPYFENKKPLESIYYPDFIVLNQSERANNVLTKSMVKLKLIINGPTLKKSEKISEISRPKRIR